MRLPSPWIRSGLPTQSMPDGLNRLYNLTNARVARWPTHQVPRTGRLAAPQMAHCFEAFQKALTRLGPLQSSTITQSVTHGHMAAFDRLVVSPRARWSPVRVCRAPWHVVATAFTYGWW